MTGRSVDAWRSDNPDAAIPTRVKLRILARQENRCAGVPDLAIPCGREFTATNKPEFDHETALILGGAHDERNLRALCRACHGAKTKVDVATKAKVARVKSKHLGLRPKSRNPLPGSKASPFKRTICGRTVRRDE